VTEKTPAVRALFLLLLLVNLLFAAWSLWVAPVPAVAGLAAPAASGPGTIRLLRELPAPSPSADAGLAALDDASLACVSVGPYLDREEAGRAAARLGALGYAVRLREGRDEVRVGQWVRIEGLATPEGMVAAARSAGFEPRVVDALRTADVAWLDVDRQANGGLPAPEQLQAPEPGRMVQLALRPCPGDEPAAGAPPDAMPEAPATAPQEAASGSPVPQPPATPP